MVELSFFFLCTLIHILWHVADRSCPYCNATKFDRQNLRRLPRLDKRSSESLVQFIDEYIFDILHLFLR